MKANQSPPHGASRDGQKLGAIGRIEDAEAKLTNDRQFSAVGAKMQAADGSIARRNGPLMNRRAAGGIRQNDPQRSIVRRNPRFVGRDGELDNRDPARMVDAVHVALEAKIEDVGPIVVMK